MLYVSKCELFSLENIGSVQASNLKGNSLQCYGTYTCLNMYLPTSAVDLHMVI